MPDYDEAARPTRAPKLVEITIDRTAYRVPKDELTGEELRALPEPDIGPDRDLYLERKGDDEDDLIEPGEVVKIKRGEHFFTAPATITPGHAA
ncbi:MAG: multiubiquitin domain-containing protein [Solirubrobacteraceae bacterium]